MKRILNAVLNVLFPHHCFLCNTVLSPHQRLCADCIRNAPYVLPPVCELCGRGEEHCICGGHRRDFRRCVSPFYHVGVARDSILQYKQLNYTVAAEGFAAEMAEVVRREYGGIPFDVVTSVPLHKKDLHLRGFDQAAGLAQILAKRLDLPYEPLLTKLERTEPQKELSLLLRRGNLLGVFDVIGDVTDRTVLLVDDVITTGSTLNECAKMLKIFGAAEVYAVTAAAAVLKKDDT